MRLTNAGSSSSCWATYRWVRLGYSNTLVSFAERRSLPPVSVAHASWQSVSAKGLGVSQVVQRFLENLLVQRDFRQGILEPAVFQFQFLEAFGRVGLHAAVMEAPAVEGGARLTASFWQTWPMVAPPLSSPSSASRSLAMILFRGVLLAFHREFFLARWAG